ncbi:MAG: nucleoside hydrolase [Intrasporangium sp.]|uniref:nucleoside hydrolase n=1 Tax=Intrasporangium sp. TaxID=1925024 RepID=UPI00264942AF|nr:nucleoside hydrolase [Intrasporangium sp.]MDN5796715.1 nucleoside hydrolase [Intrasporangium sp.]
MTSAHVPVVLDVDTGVDDACAIALAALHPRLDLRAVTCVGGNPSVDDVVRNTLVVLDAAERPDVPVARGAERPLLETPVDARHVHGRDGMGDLGWPPSRRSAAEGHPVELLRDVCTEAVAIVLDACQQLGIDGPRAAQLWYDTLLAPADSSGTSSRGFAGATGPTRTTDRAGSAARGTDSERNS